MVKVIWKRGTRDYMSPRSTADRYQSVFILTVFEERDAGLQNRENEGAIVETFADSIQFRLEVKILIAGLQCLVQNLRALTGSSTLDPGWDKRQNEDVDTLQSGSCCSYC